MSTEPIIEEQATMPEWTVDNVAEAGPWQEFYKVASTRMRRVRGPFRVLTSSGPVVCEDGWLALDARGIPYPIDTAEHDLIYREATEVEGERLRTTFAEKVAAQYAARRCAEALLSFQNFLGATMGELTPVLNAAMSAHPDPASAAAHGAIEQIDRLAQFLLSEHPELISGGSAVEVAINAIATMAGSNGTPTTEMLRAVRDNLVIYSTRTGRVGWRLPHEALRQHQFRYLAQNALSPWSDEEKRAYDEASQAGLIAVDGPSIVLTNGGRAALGLVVLDEHDPDPINSGLAEPGKLG